MRAGNVEASTSTHFAALNAQHPLHTCTPARRRKSVTFLPTWSGAAQSVHEKSFMVGPARLLRVLFECDPQRAHCELGMPHLHGNGREASGHVAGALFLRESLPVGQQMGGGIQLASIEAGGESLHVAGGESVGFSSSQREIQGGVCIACARAEMKKAPPAFTGRASEVGGRWRLGVAHSAGTAEPFPSTDAQIEICAIEGGFDFKQASLDKHECSCGVSCRSANRKHRAQGTNRGGQFAGRQSGARGTVQVPAK